jgi:membrane-associated phospholipid phosphatase
MKGWSKKRWKNGVSLVLFFRFLFLSLIFWLLSYSFSLSFAGERRSVSQILISDISFEFQRKKEEFPKVILGTTVALTAAIPLSLADQYVRNLVLSSYDKTKYAGKVMSFLGEEIFLVPFCFAGYIFGLVSDNEKVRLGFMRAIYNLAFTTFIVQSLKFSGRERPAWAEYQYSFSPLRFEDRWRSFPSGHSQASSSVYFTVAKDVCESKLCSAVFYSLPFIVGAGRILVNDHWLSDVAGGIIIGFSFEVF